MYSCYEDPSNTTPKVLVFETHEWEKHGECAGVKDVDDFFQQVCGLAFAPLRMMEQSMTAGKNVQGVAEDLQHSGFNVFDVDTTNAQVELSACAGVKSNMRWVLAPPEKFEALCGGGQPKPTPTPGPVPNSCSSNAHGPPCRRDSDCLHTSECVRCASTGFCTNQPLVGDAS